jgi:hypothetical protein
MIKKGLLGNHKGTEFILECRANLDRNEIDLIDQYAMNEYVLIWQESADGKTPYLRLNELINGKTYRREDINEITSLQNNIKTGLENLKNTLAAASSWHGNEEVIYQTLETTPSDF